MADFSKPYNPQETEPRIYDLWQKSGYFRPENLPDAEKRKPFTIMMPPANANGDLHAGHALVLTIEDILIRYQRMRGRKALWLPGTDHAGFETQIVYERALEKQGRSRFEIERQELYNEIKQFTENNKKNIVAQAQKLGASCDWTRETFTLDQHIVDTVYTTFHQLYKDGLLYRGKRIISWCPKHQTSFSDLEIINEERVDTLYYLAYGPFTIATTRPETKFGDKYVVMHPDDTRYKDYKDGQKIELEWINGPITATVIKDAAIDMTFGTGVMTVTPWHDAADFEIAERHNLEKEHIIGFDGKLLPIAGEFAGMHITKARPLIVEKLRKKGLLEKTDDAYAHVVRACYKCNTLIEPQIRSQWFIKMKSLAERAITAIERDDIVFIPEQYKKIVLHWLTNIIDWNISRQIVWGIPIPAKVCAACDAGFPTKELVSSTCTSCGGVLQDDPDTFDTWFSSGQWPFATLRYPDHNDFKTYFPTDVMETAGEIIFFWVARMIMLSLYRTGTVPFRTVYLHGLVLDAKGQKMSKSKGNVANPIAITGQYGTDALRISLIIGNTPGTSLALSEERVRGYRNFANKIWNVSRFVLEHTRDLDFSVSPPLSKQDQQTLLELRQLVQSVTEDMEHFKFYLAAEKLYHYVWHTFADKILEEIKLRLKGENAQDKASAQYILHEILTTCLKLLHPFMPFVTEAVWEQVPMKNKNVLIIQSWPQFE